MWAVGPGAVDDCARIAAAMDVSLKDSVRLRLNTNIVEAALLFARVQRASLVLVHAWQPVAETRVASHASAREYSAYLDACRQGAKADFADFCKSFGDRLDGIPLELVRGNVEDAIPEFVVAEGIDLVVMGTFGRTGIARHVLGNTVERLLSRLPCSIVAVKPTARKGR